IPTRIFAATLPPGRQPIATGAPPVYSRRSADRALPRGAWPELNECSYNWGMKTRTVVELPGYVTVAVAAERLRLAPRSVRDLVYAGRMPSARLGRRHFLRVPDVETERRRRLGLPLPQPRRVSRRAARGAEGR